MSKASLLYHKRSNGDKWLLVGDVFGWIGATMLISAYLLASAGVINGQSLVYQLLNIFGSIGMLILALARRAAPSAVTNLVWLFIGLVSIVNLFFI